mgnify:CR=1 FL=1
MTINIKAANEEGEESVVISIENIEPINEWYIRNLMECTISFEKGFY